MYVLPDDDRGVGRWGSLPVVREAGKNMAYTRTSRLTDVVWLWLAGETQEAIAKVFGVTKNRINQHLKDAPKRLCEHAGVRDDDGYDIILEAFPSGELVHTVSGGVYLRLHGSPSARVLILREPTRF